ncbi:hypothetical protein ACIA8H_10505 [Streptomyces goshikiensis]|uniref:effector-associated constant component EACC1 n=1 Tax=Streptomyces goshikiensis TaxID=1942 RepID=UPI0037BBD2EB
MTFDFVAVFSVAASAVVALATAVLAVRTWHRARGTRLSVSITTRSGAEVNVTADGIRAVDSAVLAAEIAALLNQLEARDAEMSEGGDVNT